MKKGSLSINSENIFPVIKKWLYSDHDIFVRELISNGCDAVTKLKKLSLMGEFDEPDEPYRIDVIASPDNKTLQFIDNGIGMTAEEQARRLPSVRWLPLWFHLLQIRCHLSSYPGPNMGWRCSLWSRRREEQLSLAGRSLRSRCQDLGTCPHGMELPIQAPVG